MLKILQLFIDSVFPPRVTELHIRKSASYQKSKIPIHLGKDFVYLSEYIDPLIRSLIIENKYYDNLHAQKYLAKILTEWLLEKKDVLLIPIPLGTKRYMERGYNQVENILRALPKSPTYSINTSLLTRTRNTVPQTSLEKEARIANMRNAFICSDPKKLATYSPSTIVIVDDVVTTGATLRAARAALSPHVAPETTIICLALAH